MLYSLRHAAVSKRLRPVPKYNLTPPLPGRKRQLKMYCPRTHTPSGKMVTQIPSQGLHGSGIFSTHPGKLPLLHLVIIAWSNPTRTYGSPTPKYTFVKRSEPKEFSGSSSTGLYLKDCGCHSLTIGVGICMPICVIGRYV